MQRVNSVSEAKASDEERASERFAGIYQSELDVLRELTSHASKAYLWLKMGGAAERQASVRQVADGAGLSKDQAARALRELTDSGLLVLDQAGSFERKRKASSYKIGKPFRRAGGAAQSRQRDNAPDYSRKSATKPKPIVAPVRQTSGLQSHECDTFNNASSASPQKRKDEEAFQGRASVRRVGELADSLQLPLMTLLTKTDGPARADELAVKVNRGELTLDQVRRRLAEPSRGLLNESSVVPLVLSTSKASA